MEKRKEKVNGDYSSNLRISSFNWYASCLCALAVGYTRHASILLWSRTYVLVANNTMLYKSDVNEIFTAINTC